MPNLGERLLIVFTSLAATLAAFVILISLVMVGNRSATPAEGLGIQLMACALTLAVWGLFRVGIYLFSPGPGDTASRNKALLIALIPLGLIIAVVVLGGLVNLKGR